MNEINAAERQRQAALSKAETAKILRVKEAEAEAESRHLAGKGLAMARQGMLLFTLLSTRPRAPILQVRTQYVSLEIRITRAMTL